MKNQYLEDEISKLKKVTGEVKTWFGPLSEEQLNWKLSPEKWSIGQCLDHLIISNELYFDIFARVTEGSYQQPFWKYLPFMPKLIGKMLLSSLYKDKQKFKTAKHMVPASSNIAPDIVEKFATHQEELEKVMLATDNVNHEKIIVISPVARSVIYTLEHSIRIIIAHEERHARQAKRVYEQGEFPK